jgi:nicotinamide-nucleotide amidase
VGVLGIPEKDIEHYGAVSRQVAEKMAQGIRLRAETNIGLATTGIAGPLGGSRETPVGTVFIGLDHEGGTEVWKLHLGGDREAIKEEACQKGLEMLVGYLIATGDKAGKEPNDEF